MKYIERIIFIRAMCKNVMNDITGNKCQKMPGDWDGMELRQYILDYIKENVAYKPMSRGRYLKYKNTCVINGL